MVYNWSNKCKITVIYLYQLTKFVHIVDRMFKIFFRIIESCFESNMNVNILYVQFSQENITYQNYVIMINILQFVHLTERLVLYAIMLC